jgi:SPP1 family predicted phage head-tail adaptor
MRQRCTISNPVESIDSAGQPTVTWSTFLTNEPCEFIPTGGNESMRGRQLEASVKAVVTVRYRSGYNIRQSLTLDGTRYGITHINPVGGINRYLELFCGAVQVCFSAD